MGRTTLLTADHACKQCALITRRNLCSGVWNSPEQSPLVLCMKVNTDSSANMRRGGRQRRWRRKAQIAWEHFSVMHWLNFPGYWPPGTCHPHLLQAEVTQAKPEQQLMLISISPVLCFLLLRKRVSHLLLLRSEWNSLCTSWCREAFGFFGTVLWSVDVYTIALPSRQGTVLAIECYFIGTNLNLSLPFTEQHLCSASALALNIVTVLSVTEKAWLLIPAYSAQAVEESLSIWLR